MLSFQRLDVYQRAIEFLALVYDIVDVLPRGHADRADQLTRAAESVVRISPKALVAGPKPTARTATRSPGAKPWSALRPSTS
jgi:hypothetical protein